MFSRTMTSKSTKDFSRSIELLKSALDRADAVIVGAGAGLSTSAGYTYSGERFERYFSDFEKRYGFHDMYSGGFYPYKSLEEYWAYWSRYVFWNRYAEIPSDVYANLLKLVKGKDYFVITTNVDHCFQKAGFDKKRLFYTQGDYGLWQCSEPCHDKTYDNEETIRKMVAEQSNMKIPSELVPRCPICGKPLSMNLRSDDTFVEDEGWHRAAERYSLFLRRYENTRLLLLELGVGYNTPGIIKIPFWEMASRRSNVTYACINMSDTAVPISIEKNSICIKGDIGEALRELTIAD